MLKKGTYGADQTEKVGAFRAERTADRTGENGCIQKKWVLLEDFRANRTVKVGAFRANKTQKGGLYRGTYPYCFNMGIPPPPPGTCTSLLLTGFCWTWSETSRRLFSPAVERFSQGTDTLPEVSKERTTSTLSLEPSLPSLVPPFQMSSLILISHECVLS